MNQLTQVLSMAQAVRSALIKINSTSVTSHLRGHQNESLLFLCAQASTILAEQLRLSNIEAVIKTCHFSPTPTKESYANHSVVVWNGQIIDITASQYNSRAAHFPEVVVCAINNPPYNNLTDPDFTAWPEDQRPSAQVTAAVLASL